jgi:5,10-methylene-tetrahydrofolate dehydrogenase/methenyl tetrahydrofolate cyclohydrolase
VLAAISVDKDVDGFHPLNIGKLAMKVGAGGGALDSGRRQQQAEAPSSDRRQSVQAHVTPPPAAPSSPLTLAARRRPQGREPLFVPCTPAGCLELLDRIGVDLRGKRAVVVGRSNIVGMPVAMLLLKRNATVTICHSASTDMPSIVKEADVVVAAAGQAQMIKARRGSGGEGGEGGARAAPSSGETPRRPAPSSALTPAPLPLASLPPKTKQGSWIKPGAVIIDVGTNPIDDATRKLGYRLVGDCDFEDCRQVAGAVTCVPGGVGPMTIAMLLKNTLTSAERFYEGQARWEAVGAGWRGAGEGKAEGASVAHGTGGAAAGRRRAAAALTRPPAAPPLQTPRSHKADGEKQPHWSTVALGTLAGAAVVQGVVKRALGLSGSGRPERR